MKAIKELVIEKIKLEGVLEELKRSKPYTKTNYYWNRSEQVKKRLADINYILNRIQKPTEDEEFNNYVLNK